MPWIESFVGAAFGATSVAGALGYVGKHLLDHSLKREELLLKSKLSEIAAINKEVRDAQANVRVVVKRYSRVVLLSASDLQDRLWHLCRRTRSVRQLFLGGLRGESRYATWPMTAEHYLISTMYCFARYLCWIEILKHNISLLEFNEDNNTREFNHHVKRIERMLADTHGRKCFTLETTSDEPVFQFMQMEIGEALCVTGTADLECMTFHAFRLNYAELLSQNNGMAQLQKLVLSGIRTNTKNFCMLRLKLIHNALIDLLVFLNAYNGLDAAEPLDKLSLDFFNQAEYDKKWPAFVPNPVENSEAS